MLTAEFHTTTAPTRMPLASGAKCFTKHLDMCHASLRTTQGSRSPPLASPFSR